MLTLSHGLWTLKVQLLKVELQIELHDEIEKRVHLAHRSFILDFPYIVWLLVLVHYGCQYQPLTVRTKQQGVRKFSAMMNSDKHVILAILPVHFPALIHCFKIGCQLWEYTCKYIQTCPIMCKYSVSWVFCYLCDSETHLHIKLFYCLVCHISSSHIVYQNDHWMSCSSLLLYYFAPLLLH